jgi:hypothetical protein
MKKYRPTKNNEGGRNLFCSQYSHCLDYAIDKAWDSWNCSKCDFKNKQGDRVAMASIYSEEIPYYEFGDGFSSSDLDVLAGY